jgi:hypothetical protein
VGEDWTDTIRQGNHVCFLKLVIPVLWNHTRQVRYPTSELGSVTNGNLAISLHKIGVNVRYHGGQSFLEVKRRNKLVGYWSNVFFLNFIKFSGFMEALVQ